MTLLDTFQETYSALSANKARSSLTILGIVIGIASVIAMISIGQGAQSQIESNIQAIGSNLIIVMPGAQRGAGVFVSSGRGSARTLKRGDADAIASDVANVRAVAPELTSRYQVTAKGSNTNTQVVGTTPEYPSVRNIEVENGSFITTQNVHSASKVAVIGPTVQTDLFGEGGDAMGQTIRINRVQFTVVGITKAKGGSGFNNPDDVIYVPISTAERFLAGDDYVSSISVAATEANVTTQVQQDVTQVLMNRHKILDPTQADFSTLNQADIIATASSVTGTFTLLLAAIAGISLLVGGIGIMNMMLTTVTERTREIGLRKAIGAKRADINMQFLAEAVSLTFLGGMIGVALGWSAAQTISHFANLRTTVLPSSVLLAFGVSAGIGIVFGYYPARRASKLNPIEALRYE